MRLLTQFDGLHLEKLSYPNQISPGDKLQLLTYSFSLNYGGGSGGGGSSDPSDCFRSRVNIHEPVPGLGEMNSALARVSISSSEGSRQEAQPSREIPPRMENSR